MTKTFSALFNTAVSRTKFKKSFSATGTSFGAIPLFLQFSLNLHSLHLKGPPHLKINWSKTIFLLLNYRHFLIDLRALTSVDLATIAHTSTNPLPLRIHLDSKLFIVNILQIAILHMSYTAWTANVAAST